MNFVAIADLRYYDNLPYHVETEESEHTDGSTSYRAFHPELPGCSSHGDTPEEAVEDLKDARRCYLETLLESGQKIPLPTLPTTQSWIGHSAIPSTWRYRMASQPWLGNDAPYLY